MKVGLGDTPAARLRRGLPHPVVDADGHFIETAPVFRAFFLDYVKDLGGAELAGRFERAGGLDYDDMVLRPWSQLSEAEKRRSWQTRPPWWTLPAANTLDRATAHLPRLMYERLDDLGIDFAVLYPSRGLTTTHIREDELRQIACRAFNVFHAEVYAPFADRMRPVAQIPMHTPQEAIAELEYAVGELGFSAIMINGVVKRPVGADASPGSPNWGAQAGERLDALGVDSEYDYDPFWQRCIDLRVAPASHTPGMGWSTRNSISSYVFNHIGSFGASQELLCRSLFLGGVTRRFPQLAFGLLEGGVGWACSLFEALISHWEKRNRESIRQLDPANVDGELLLRLFESYGDERFSPRLPGLRESFEKLEPEPPALDEYAACEIERLEDFVELFVPHFYFGCEADDPMVAWAFDERVNPLGVKLRAMFSSDMGHWDVPDMTRILPEAYELVEKGLIGEAEFAAFSCENPIRLYTSLNPDFFAGTSVEAEAARLLEEDR
ncbi:MAG: amidohydrolase family protein [Proteobacteria bacterium]|nr:amidohydrolase family protein [Pseudomonadota bacterium]